jgi:methyl-accepting chemotaxis protein
MPMINNFKIGTRLMIGFSVMLMLILVLGISSLLSIRGLSENMKKTLDQDAKLAEYANKAVSSAMILWRYEKDAINNIGDSSARDLAISQWNVEILSLPALIEILQAITEKMDRKEDADFLKQSKDSLTAYTSGIASVFEKIKTGELTSSKDVSSAILPYQKDSRRVEFLLLIVSNRSLKSLQDARIVSDATSRRSMIFSVINIIVAMVLGIVISLLISTSIRKPLSNLSARLKDISEGEGDLTAEILVRGKDETGILAIFFNKFVSKIRTVVKDAKGASAKLISTAHELTSTATNLTENVREQAASSEEISATIDEVSSGVESIANNASNQFSKLTSLVDDINNLSTIIREMEKAIKETLTLSTDISVNAKSGEETIRLMTNSMAKITDSSGKISGIISIINDISDRINLLSLNAAIEAARAGDAGRGFAVVADEISKLADQTSESIKEIDLLVRINTEETATGMANVTKTNQTIGRSIEGVNAITKKMDAIFSFMNSQVQISANVDSEINKLKNISDEIRIATAEQKIAFVEIIKSISLINELSQSNAASSEELAGISEDIAKLSLALDDRVNFFKV